MKMNANYSEKEKRLLKRVLKKSVAKEQTSGGRDSSESTL